MSVDYSASLAIGYEVTTEMLERFKVRTDPVWHMEARFNPKTGEKLPDERIEDEPAGEVYRFGGAEYDYPEDLINDLCHKLNACYHSSMEYYGDTADMYFVVGPRLKSVEDYEGEDIGKLSIYGKMDWQDVLALGEELNRIGQELLKAGIIRHKEHERAVVTLVGSEH